MDNRTKNYCWTIVLIVLSITIIIIMYLVGMSDLYISPPLYIGLGQYIDIKAGVLCVCFVGISVIIYLTFKKKKR